MLTQKFPLQISLNTRNSKPNRFSLPLSFSKTHALLPLGACASSRCTNKAGEGLKWPSSKAKIIHLDGRLQEFKQPIKASHVLSQNPKCFICNSELMCIDSHLPQMAADEELQLGQIYFLMPLNKSQLPFSLQDLCELAIKASAALAHVGYSSDILLHCTSDKLKWC